MSTPRRSLPFLRLSTVYPCCGIKAYFRALLDVPRESYERRCPNCGASWTVRREILTGREGKIRLDKLEWERKS